MPVAYIALGTNLGERLDNLRRAIEALKRVGRLTICSSVYETEPREYTDQPWFLNAVITIETHDAPETLMQELLKIERELGRERHADMTPKGPRVIDLDLLLYAEEVIDSGELRLPHPRMHERLFVLDPLVEIAPRLILPVQNRKIRDLRDALRSDKTSGTVRHFAAPLC